MHFIWSTLGGSYDQNFSLFPFVFHIIQMHSKPNAYITMTD